jgi:hypothetical protein
MSMANSKTNKLSSIETKLNRLKAKRAALEHTQKMDTKRERLKRTRTLIQLGGLLSIVKIPQRFEITLGDDLQTDLHNHEKAATLLGLLITVVDQLPNAFSEAELSALKKKGISSMTAHSLLSEYSV